MDTTRRLDPEALHRQLRRALRHGARASRLARFTPELVELLFPADDRPDLSIVERALLAERLIRDAVEDLGGDYGRALSIVLALAPGTLGLRLEQRRQMAAELLGVLPDTFRRKRHEGLMVWDLAVEIVRQTEIY